MAEDRPAAPQPVTPPQPPALVEAARMPAAQVAAAQVAVVALLLAVTVAGLQARALLHPERPAGAHAIGQVAVTVFGAAEALAAICLISVFILAGRRPRRRRPGDGEHIAERTRPSRLSRMVALLAALAVIGLPLALLGYALRTGTRGQRDVLGYPGAPAPGRVPPHIGAAPAAGVPSAWVCAMVLLAVLIGAALLMAARRPRSAAAPPGSAPPPSRHQVLAAAASAGAAALSGNGDVRAAVIACYAAMERTLADGGAAPGPSDTPAEVLGRAARAGLTRSPAAATLTGLFRLARYGSGPLDETDRTAAAGALQQLRAEIAAGAGSMAGVGSRGEGRDVASTADSLAAGPPDGGAAP